VPIFEFTCRKCGAGFEEILSLAELEAGELVCPACGSDRVERTVSTFAAGSVGGATAGGRGACGGGLGGGFT
jgi:putative FmdB family regulatory protein